MKPNRCAHYQRLAPTAVLLLFVVFGAPARPSEAAALASPYAAALNLNGSPCNPSPVGVTSLLGFNPGSQIVYALTKSGLYRADARSTKGWDAVNQNIGAITAIAPSAHDAGDVLFLREHSILRSMNGGASLNTTATAPTSNVYDLARAPSDPATLYALSAAGDTAGSNTQAGVYRSSDTGVTWTQVYTGGTNWTGVDQVAPPVIAPSDANALAQIESGYHGGSISYSLDGGQTWGTLEDTALTANLLAPTTFTFNPGNARDVWVEYQSWQGFPGGVLVRTTNGGHSWAQVPYGMPAYPDVRAIAVDPQGPVYVSLAGNGTGVPNPLFVAPDTRHFVRLLPPGNPNVGHQLALVAEYRALLTWDSEHPLWAITTRRPGGFDPLKDAASAPAGSVYVAATHHAIGAPFLTFYTQHGGLRAFGLPISQPVREQGVLVQYFERARLALTGQTVTPTPIGSMACAGRVFPAVPVVADTGTRRYFTATHHSLSGRFLTYWKQHEGSLLLGAPISEPLREQNGDGSGRVYLLQYFANGRLEYHPELGAGHDVSLGLMGSEYLHRAGLR